VHIRIDANEHPLRDAIKLLGGRYHPATGTWQLAYAAAIALRLTERIISDISAHNRRGRDEELADLQWRVGVGSK
jgi:hypothetical protein